MTVQLTIHKSTNGLRCEGALTIETAAELLAALSTALQAGPETELDLSNITECDVSGVQLLYAAGQCAKAQRQHFTIIGSSAAVTETSEAVGAPLDQFHGQKVNLV